MKHLKATCPLYIDTNLKMCELNHEGCPYRGVSKTCTAYREIKRYTMILNAVHKHEEAKGLEVRV